MVIMSSAAATADATGVELLAATTTDVSSSSSGSSSSSSRDSSSSPEQPRPHTHFDPTRPPLQPTATTEVATEQQPSSAQHGRQSSPYAAGDHSNATAAAAAANERQQTTAAAAAKPKRNPYCSRCRNHGKSAQVKGHKRHCEYRHCQCDGCKLVEFRQMVSAAQIKQRRDQKQDEESGRRIEVSPPVLKRDAATAAAGAARRQDPAELLAKSLISVRKQSVQSAATPTTPLHTPPEMLATARPSPSFTGTLAGAQAATNLSSHFSSLHTQQHHHHHAHHHHHLPQPAQPHLLLGPAIGGIQQQQASGAAAAAAASLRLGGPSPLRSLEFAGPQATPSPVNISQQHLGPQLLPGQLQLYQLAAAPQMLQSGGGGSGGVAPTQLGNCLSPRDQLNLVKEIDQTLGPLAIFAWLRSEQFNLAKVRALIELAKVPFDELLQVNGHSPLDLTSPIVD